MFSYFKLISYLLWVFFSYLPYLYNNILNTNRVHSPFLFVKNKTYNYHSFLRILS